MIVFDLCTLLPTHACSTAISFGFAQRLGSLTGQADLAGSAANHREAFAPRGGSQSVV
jgi:hypothetical protein